MLAIRRAGILVSFFAIGSVCSETPDPEAASVSLAIDKIANYPVWLRFSCNAWEVCRYQFGLRSPETFPAVKLRDDVRHEAGKHATTILHHSARYQASTYS